MPRARKPDSPEATVWVGGDVERVTVCLRVLGDDLDPREITATLGVEPTRSGRKGEPVSRANGEVARYRRVGCWLLDLAPPSDATVDEAIAALLSELPQDPAVWRPLVLRFRVDLLCDVTVRGVNQGFVISPDMLKSVAELGIPLGFDLFAVADDDQAALLAERLRRTM